MHSVHLGSHPQCSYGAQWALSQGEETEYETRIPVELKVIKSPVLELEVHIFCQYLKFYRKLPFSSQIEHILRSLVVLEVIYLNLKLEFWHILIHKYLVSFASHE